MGLRMTMLLVGALALTPQFGRAATGQRDRAALAPYASATPILEPQLFEPGRISTGDYDSHPQFTPDGRTLYFTKVFPDISFYMIVVSHFENGAWTAPEVAPFSGRWPDADPFITRDGAHLFFVSRRPAHESDPFDPAKRPDIWVMDRTPSGWSEPRSLEAPVNSDASEWYPCVTDDGTLYFGSSRMGGRGGCDIYRSRLVDGKYATPENLGDAINTPANEFEPFVAPDGSLMIYMVSGREDSLGGQDFYVSYWRDGAWTKAANLGAPINSGADEFSPKITPDGKYFFWTSARSTSPAPPRKPFNYAQLSALMRGPGNGLGDIYRIDLGALHLAKGIP